MYWLTKLRLRTRLSLLTALALLLLFGFMVFESAQALETATHMTLQERLALAHTVALHIDQDLERTLSRLEQVAAFPTINLEDGDMEPEKAELRDLYRPQLFSYVFLLDKDGLALWTEPYLAEVVGIKHLECPHVQEVLRTGQPGIACVAHALTPLSPVVAPVVPIRNQEGAIVGALGGAIDPSSPAFSDLLRRVIPGRTGYAQLVDENGIVLAHTEGRRLFQKSEHADLFISLLREKQAAVSTETVTEEGKGTFREVIAFAPLTVAPWGVAVEQEEAELLAPALELRNRAILFAVGALAAALLLVWVITRSVVQPVRKLVAASQRIAAGDLATPVPPLGEDEIGELGRRFEEMRQRLEQHQEVMAAWGEELETKVKERTRELSILYTINRATAQSLELDQMLNDAVEATLEALQIEAGGIFLLEPQGAGEQRGRGAEEQEMVLRVHRGLSDEFVRAVERIRLGEGISGRAAAEGRPLVLDVADYPTERLVPPIVKEGFQTLASTPLLSAGKVLGALNLGTRRARAFPPEELELLEAIGRQLGGAVQNARLYQKVLASEQEYRTLVENATELIWTLDTEGRFTYFNRQAEEVSSYKVEDWVGRSFAPLIPSADLPRIQQVFVETLGGKAQSYEVGVYRADGSLF